MDIKILSGFVLIISVSFIIELIDAECCYRVSRMYCADGTFVNGRYCGYGECNAAGCNCEGGCRKFKPLKSSRADFYTTQGEKCTSQCEFYSNPTLGIDDYYWCYTAGIPTPNWGYCSPRRNYDTHGIPCRSRCKDNHCFLSPFKLAKCGRVDDKCLAELKTDFIRALDTCPIKNDRLKRSINNQNLDYPNQTFNELWSDVISLPGVHIYWPNNRNTVILRVYYIGSLDTTDTIIVRAVEAEILSENVGGRYTPFPNSLNSRMEALQAWGYGNNNQPTDERGHLVASQLGGGNEWYNLVPMSRSLNRNYGSFTGWINNENRIRMFMDQCTRRALWRVVLAYNHNSNRPIGLRLNYEMQDDYYNFLYEHDHFYQQ